MADVTINALSPITPTTGLFLPASDSNTTGKVTLSQVCGVMTSSQITTALGYTPYNGATNPNGYLTSSTLPAGSIKQVIYNSYSTTTSIGTSNTDTGLNASITLTNPNNKVLVRVEQALWQYAQTAGFDSYTSMQLHRNNSFIFGTNDATAPGWNSIDLGNNLGVFIITGIYPFTYMDTPGAGTHTYKTVCKMLRSPSTAIAQNNNAPSMITLMEIAV